MRPAVVAVLVAVIAGCSSGPPDLRTALDDHGVQSPLRDLDDGVLADEGATICATPASDLDDLLLRRALELGSELGQYWFLAGALVEVGCGERHDDIDTAGSAAIERSLEYFAALVPEVRAAVDGLDRRGPGGQVLESLYEELDDDSLTFVIRGPCLDFSAGELAGFVSLASGSGRVTPEDVLAGYEAVLGVACPHRLGLVEDARQRLTD